MMPESKAILGSRAAMRAIPALVLPSKQNESDEKISLASFRLLALAWTFSVYANSRKLRTAILQATDAYPAATLTLQPSSQHFVLAACRAAAFAAATKDLSARFIDVSDLVSYTDHAFEKSLSKEIKKAVQTDIEVMQSKNPLCSAPLWADIPESIEEKWRVLRQAFLDTGNEWDVWTNWYDARLRGSSAHQREELSRVTVANSVWTKAPVVVNRAIKKALAAKDDLEQDKTAQLFASNANGQIDVSSPAPGMALLNTPSQRSLYNSVRTEARELYGQGPNLLGEELNRRLSGFVESSPEIEVASGVEYWPRLNALRSILRKHDASTKHRDVHLVALDRGIAEDLRNLVSLANAHSFGDPTLQSLDEKSVGPREAKEIENEYKESRVIIEVIVTQDEIPTADAKRELLARADEADNTLQDELGCRTVDQARKTNKNFVAATLSELVRVARSAEDGLVKEEVKQVLPAFHDLLKNNIDIMEAYVSSAFNSVDTQAFFSYLLHIFK